MYSITKNVYWIKYLQEQCEIDTLAVPPEIYALLLLRMTQFYLGSKIHSPASTFSFPESPAANGGHATVHLLTEHQSSWRFIGSKAFALSMKGNGDAETLILLNSTLDTDTMPEAPEEVIG